MTDVYDADSEDAAAQPDWPSKIYEVFNPEGTVGVACNRDGEIVGLHLTDDARDEGDTWLAGEIVRLGKLAHLKSRVGLRAEMMDNGTGAHTIDAFDLPTENSYRQAERSEFGQ
ncbi:hypothetical protein KO481_35510 [Nocardia sp. NEAU-G5]|uniref:Uncharacterized protein n=1 Tax=Nocardia albiluteola TaxID=2842303 RepID=A0ABS6B938_9NOCA|nr:hypothetical protein [Nocardia albiluteola]